ncbi:glycosyltransferase [Novosphingobium huizhouense]|uniref:glycosyltransferase n=1 Tax=Novosphingobium huizhouense TaxID=2866625 RepID=UPI001CD8CAFB|nr:glycosyltransferase [Novosphingobium huizhouense]
MTAPVDSRPLVSVVLLTYNHARFIAQAIESVLMQEAPFAFELIVTDDHSTDGTWDIVERFAAEHPTIVPIRSAQNLNTNEVTTRAIAKARGEFVAFLDGDDYWTRPDKLAVQVAFLRSDSACSLCCHDVSVIDADGEIVRASFAELNPAPLIGDYRSLSRTNYIPGPSPLVRRSALEPLPDWFEKVEFGDWALYLAALRHGHIGYLPEVMAAYRVHAGGYWSGLSRADQHERLIRFYDALIAHGPPAWREEFGQARDAREAQWVARPATEPQAPPRRIEIDLAAISAGHLHIAPPNETVELDVRWSGTALGALPFHVGDSGLSASAAIAAIARSGLGWTAVSLLLERTVYPRLVIKADGPTCSAWLDDEMLADGLPADPASRLAALHERIDWHLLERELRPRAGPHPLLMAALFKRPATSGKLAVSIDLARPLPRILTNAGSLTIRVCLASVLLKEIEIVRTGTTIEAAEIAAGCTGWGYALAKAAFIGGVVGYALDDRTPLPERLARAGK